MMGRSLKTESVTVLFTCIVLKTIPCLLFITLKNLMYMQNAQILAQFKDPMFATSREN